MLRASVALACLGYWGQLALHGESPLLEWLNSPSDVGGLGWSEPAALAATRACGWLTLCAGWIIVIRPSGGASLAAALAPTLSAWAMWSLSDGFPLRAPWLPLPMRQLFPFFTHAARAAAPWGLLLLEPWLAPRPLSRFRVMLGLRTLQATIAATFAAHGLEAWQLNPEFVDLLIGSAANVLGWSLPQSLAEYLLRGIGLADLTTALACLAMPPPWNQRSAPGDPSPSVAKAKRATHGVWWWMALWGALTAASRITAYGFDIGWPQTLIRACHAGIPLALMSAPFASLAARKLD